MNETLLRGFDISMIPDECRHDTVHFPRHREVDLAMAPTDDFVQLSVTEVLTIRIPAPVYDRPPA